MTLKAKITMKISLVTLFLLLWTVLICSSRFILIYCYGRFYLPPRKGMVVLTSREKNKALATLLFGFTRYPYQICPVGGYSGNGRVPLHHVHHSPLRAGLVGMLDEISTAV